MNLAKAAPLCSGNGKPKGRGALILNSKCGKYSSISMLLIKSKSSQNPSSLNRELQHIESRIKSLENSTYSLRNLVPLGLKDMVGQTSQDLTSLQAFFSNNNQKNENSNENSNENVNENDDSQKIDIDEQLNNLRQKILTRLDSSIDSLSKSITDEKQNDSEQKIKASTNKNLINFEEDYLDEMQQRIDISTENFNEKKYKIQERIKAIQKNAQKLHDIFYIKSKKDGENAALNLKEIEEDCKIHKNEITGIKAKIADIKQNISSSNKAKVAPKTEPQNENLRETKIEKIFASNTLISDFQYKIIELKQTADEIKTEFQNSLKELKAEADQCEDESQKLTQTIASISSSTEAIENSANDASKLATELQCKVNQIASKIDQQEYRNSLNAIVNKIKSTNELIAEEIKEIKRKLNSSNGKETEDVTDSNNQSD